MLRSKKTKVGETIKTNVIEIYHCYFHELYQNEEEEEGESRTLTNYDVDNMVETTIEDIKDILTTA